MSYRKRSKRQWLVIILEYRKKPQNSWVDWRTDFVAWWEAASVILSKRVVVKRRRNVYMQYEEGSLLLRVTRSSEYSTSGGALLVGFLSVV